MKKRMLIGSYGEDEINIIAAALTSLRQKLNRNGRFCEVIIPKYLLNEFKSHLRMTRGTLKIV